MDPFVAIVVVATAAAVVAGTLALWLVGLMDHH